MKPEELYRSPNALAPHYRRFRVSERLLLTGHSHQAWPDCGFDAQQQAWLDAAEHVDDKWERAFAMADRVRRGFAGLLGDPDGDIALGANTHELVVRLVSALPRQRRRILTTDGEFHTLRRQLDRWEEAGDFRVDRLAAEPAVTVGERLAAAVDESTALVAVSRVFFRNAHIAAGLDRLQEACLAAGAEEPDGAGGNGERGGAAVQEPDGADGEPAAVTYGAGAARFAGATYDPTSHYRAAAVFDFFARQRLAPELLRRVSQHQIGRLAAGFDALDADPRVISRDRETPLQEIGGFLVLRSPRAPAICRSLAARGVRADSRGETLRMGPAPYLSDRQLDDAIGILGEVVRGS